MKSSRLSPNLSIMDKMSRYAKGQIISFLFFVDDVVLLGIFSSHRSSTYKSETMVRGRKCPLQGQAEVLCQMEVFVSGFCTGMREEWNRRFTGGSVLRLQLWGTGLS